MTVRSGGKPRWAIPIQPPHLLWGCCLVSHFYILPGLCTSTLGPPLVPCHHHICEQTIGPLPIHHGSLFKILDIYQLEPVVDSDALLACVSRAPAGWPTLWAFLFRVFVITENKLQGTRPEGLLAALFPPQPPEGPARHTTQRPLTSEDGGGRAERRGASAPAH